MKDKRIWKYFVPLFLIVFVIFNWNEVSWIFNYRTVSGFFSELFKSDSQEIKPLLTNNFNNTQVGQHYGKEDSVEIAKINITAPLIFAEGSDQEDIEEALDMGVVHFPDSVLPGQAGQTIILGHSAPAGWPRINYDWVFTDLNKLVRGDDIYVFFNNKKYDYSVTRKVFLEKGGEIAGLTNNENMLILISCWPPGEDTRRIAVEAELK